MTSMIDVRPTTQLHGLLRSRFEQRPADFEKVFDTTNDRLARLGARFEGNRSIPTGITAFLIDASARDLLRDVATGLWRVVEKALDWITDDPGLLRRAFPDHQRFFPYLSKTRGSPTWQNYSRFDVVVTPRGEIKVIELNTACPAGFTLMDNVDRVAKEALTEVLGADAPGMIAGSSVSADSLVTGLLQIERQAEIPPGLIVLANDENRLVQELEPLAEIFGARGREAVIADAQQLNLAGERLTWNESSVSLTLNKMRLSTSDSQNHHWAGDFETRYADFLAAQRDRCFVSVNNLGAMTIAEDKGLLDVLRWPEIHERFDDAERALIERHVVRTWRLDSTDQSLREKLLSDKDRWVLKPANEGRGFHVHVGPYATDEQWREALDEADSFPFVAQHYHAPLTLPVVGRDEEGRMRIEEMFVTFGLAVVAGEYSGLVSRISPTPVTNVARSGMLQATFLMEG